MRPVLSSREGGELVWLAVHADVRRSPVVGRVVEALAEIFGREARALAG
ncbi:hypothetical protein [Sorangium sp. So ce1182]